MKISADARFDESTAVLASVISEYHRGLALIDREFDEACQRIQRSINDLQETAAKRGTNSKTERSRELDLLKQSEKIRRDLDAIERELAEIELGIAAIDAQILSLTQRKTDIEQQIQDRWLIEHIYYLFFEDKDKLRSAELQRNLDHRSHDRSMLEGTRQQLESRRFKVETARKSQQANLDKLQEKLAILRCSSASDDARQKELKRKIKEAEESRQTRKRKLWKVVSASWEKASGEVRQSVALVRRKQPAFSDFKGDAPQVVSEIPRVLILGTRQVSFRELTCPIPHAFLFPFERALVLPEDNDAQRRLAHHLLLRLLQAIPPGRLELTLIDPLKLGQSFAPFLPLLNVKRLMPQARVLTRADEIEQVLSKLLEETEVLIQQKFKGRISNWTEFNDVNPANPLNYKVVLLFDAPEQLSDRSYWFLERLAENGPRCGILPIVAVDSQRIEEKRNEKLREALNRTTQRLDALLRVTDHDGGGLSSAYQPEKWPRQEALETLLARIAADYSEAGRFRKSLSNLWTGCTKGTTTIGGFDVPLGWTPAGEVVSMVLGATNSEHHVLLAGKTGSGKSNLLHVLIHSLCERISPLEVDLYLLDYKESTEFTVYANPILPHARLVATESDPEYGITVLQHLVNELEGRAGLFKSSGVKDFPEYRKSTGMKLPRVLLVIDEFQVLFSSGRHVADSAERLLQQLLKQGRSFGIHVLLATQTLKGVNAMSMGGLISQLGCRIALACGQEDSAIILGGVNWAAAELKSPPEGILNTSNGAVSGNVKFVIPHAEPGFCQSHLRQFSERACKRGIVHKARVFNGAKLPQRPALAEFHCLRGPGESLLLGEHLTFSSEALTVPLARRQAFNVLFSGYNDVIHDGLLVSVLASLSSMGDFSDIVYFNGRGIPPGGGFDEMTSSLGERYRAFNEIERLPLGEIADNIGTRRAVLIVDGLDAEKALHPAQGFKVARPGDPVSPADVFKRIVEDGPRKGTFVFAFIDHWRRSTVPCKDLFGLFELRVAFCMNEDDAGAFLSGGIGKYKGIEHANRAVFANPLTRETSLFRPYSASGSDVA